MKAVISNTFEGDGEDYEVTQSQAMWEFSLKERSSRRPHAVKMLQTGASLKAEPSPSGRGLPLHSLLSARLMSSEEMGLFWATPQGATAPTSGNLGRWILTSKGELFIVAL